MGRCTARLKMLLFRAKTIVTDRGNVELSCLKKKKKKKKKKKERKKEIKEKQFARFASAWCGTFATGFATRGVLLVMKTLEDERYVVIKAYKCTVSEIWRDFFVLAYIACTSCSQSSHASTPEWASKYNLEIYGQYMYYQGFVDDFEAVLSQPRMCIVTTYGVRRS